MLPFHGRKLNDWLSQKLPYISGDRNDRDCGPSRLTGISGQISEAADRSGPANASANDRDRGCSGKAPFRRRGREAALHSSGERSSLTTRLGRSNRYRECPFPTKAAVCSLTRAYRLYEAAINGCAGKDLGIGPDLLFSFLKRRASAARQERRTHSGCGSNRAVCVSSPQPLTQRDPGRPAPLAVSVTHRLSATRDEAKRPAPLRPRQTMAPATGRRSGAEWPR